MFANMLKKDILRNKTITATLFLFVFLAAMLVSVAVYIIVTLFGGMEHLFEQSLAPHFVQMTAEEINQDEIDAFAQNNPLVESWQTVIMLDIDGANIYLGEESLVASIMDNGFVVQNRHFDFLLDLNSNIIHINDGEIAVPIYHMQRYGLQLGDNVRIVAPNFYMSFTITAFARDVQMNPAIVTSNRFLVSENDWQALHGNFADLEYLISFRLHDVSRVGEFEVMYQASSLPQTGVSLTYSLYRMLNAITDGVLAAVVILIGLLLILIAALCLRFTLTATIEEDYREIGAMKAIGISNKGIRRLYMVKYMAMGAVACILGYVVASFAGGLFTANITLYMGTAPATIWGVILPLLGALLVFLAVTLYCRVILGKFGKISAVEALRDANMAAVGRGAKLFKLSRSNFRNVHIYLGIKAVFGRFSTYIVLCFIFIAATFLMIVPQNLLNTLQSPYFVSYMGAGRSDIRLDITARQGADITQLYQEIDRFLSENNDVSAYAVLVTANYRALNADGFFENIRVEVGDFSAFPINYSSGRSPIYSNEIALSHMNAAEFEVGVGDTLILLINGEEQALTVSGIYSDITNGGRTAKGLLPYSLDDILWVVVNINIAYGMSISEMISEISTTFPSARVTDMANWVNQTMGGLIGQLSIATRVGFGLGLIISGLITAMFFKMLIAKDTHQIAIMCGLGISYSDMRLQYLTRAVIILVVGVIIGSIAAVLFGQGLAGLLIQGISSMRFIINPFISYVISPLVLALVVGITVFAGCASMRKINVRGELC